MFCDSCGRQIADEAVFCPACGSAVGQQQDVPPQTGAGQAYNRAAAADVADRAKVASQDAWQAIKLFAVNPTGGLAPAYQNLDKQRVWGAVIAFAIINGLSNVIFLRGLESLLQKYAGFLGPVVLRESPGVIQAFIGGVLGVFIFAGVIALVRLLFRGEGSFDGDCFIAGSTYLPGSLAAALSVLLGIGNVEIIIALWTFTVCYSVLILFTGYTRIAKISDGAAAVAVPLVFLVLLYALKILVVSAASNL